MALLEKAKQVAAEFEYTTEDVNRGVKEFIREMGESDDQISNRTQDVLRDIG